MSRSSLISCLLIVGLAAVTATAAQGPPPGEPGAGPGRGDPITALKQALTDAGADSLSSAQENQISELLQAYKAANAPKAPGEAGLSAMSAYQESILSGDLDGAKAAAASMAAEMTANSQTRLEKQAQLMIQILGTLSEAQTKKLSEKFETRGLFFLLQRFAGPPMGRRGMRGPMGPPPM